VSAGTPVSVARTILSPSFLMGSLRHRPLRHIPEAAPQALPEAERQGPYSPLESTGAGAPGLRWLPHRHVLLCGVPETGLAEEGLHKQECRPLAIARRSKSRFFHISALLTNHPPLSCAFSPSGHTPEKPIVCLCLRLENNSRN
jgi:hypothetical protein